MINPNFNFIEVLVLTEVYDQEEDGAPSAAQEVDEIIDVDDLQEKPVYLAIKCVESIEEFELEDKSYLTRITMSSGAIYLSKTPVAEIFTSPCISHMPGPSKK